VYLAREIVNMALQHNGDVGSVTPEQLVDMTIQLSATKVYPYIKDGLVPEVAGSIKVPKV
jgi:hypothetical protein